jgi:hypothetical protein
MELRAGLLARLAEDSDLSRNTRVVQKKGSNITYGGDIVECMIARPHCCSTPVSGFKSRKLRSYLSG